ncbi:MAG: tRNA (cytidine(34)-2'-O)-methyltransferase [Planctomycetota bacterium]|nr:tRNA (cytidine(34)-2'-O)-methyltransferase [Planctomycetota bacterium]MDA1250490.1 tRNA (cytidine(34)-2'-O)-methyltransferase [Planctomycetota bacterium]
MTTRNSDTGPEAGPVAADRGKPLLNVVLYQPDIPQNTGNIGRTCVAVGAKLWLIRPLGFRLDEKHLRRAGMDYWQHLDWEAVDSWSEVESRLPDSKVWCLTKFATRLVWDADFSPGDILLFGSETRGLPDSIREAERGRNLKLPMRDEVRSLNLASTVNSVVYEAVRQFGGL